MTTFETHMAIAGYRECEVRGRAIFGGDDHDHDVMSMLSIAMGHRALKPRESELITVLGNVTGLGDPRIWPMRAPRIVAAYGAPFLATAAADAFLCDNAISSPSVGTGMEQVLELIDEVGYAPEFDALAAVVKRNLEQGRRFAGFNVVGRDSDERRDFLLPWMEERGWLEGPHMQFVDRLGEVLLELKGIRPNVTSLWVGSGLDLGFEPTAMSMMTKVAVEWAVLGNVVEGIEPEYDEMRRLPDDHLEWRGAAPRVTPRATAEQG